MIATLRRVRPAAWALLALMAALSVFSVGAIAYRAAPSATVLYAVQPIAAAIIALIAHNLTRGQHGNVRHAKDKAIMVASIMAIWFVACFATGVFLTFVHNALVGSAQGVLLNVLSFGVTAVAVEFTRHRTLLLAGRRNIAWFGVLVTIVFAAQQMNLGQLATVATAEDLVKLVVSDILPAAVSSILLTYLALSSGLPAQLTYRLGVVAMAVLPPIIPKFDWYLTGIASLMLAVTIYLVIDATHRSGRQPRTHRHVNIALESTWACAIVALVLFMTGVFAYKPTAIMSGSMSPTFDRGSIVIVQKVSNKMDISIGDIIQYEAHGLVITHRVVDVEQSSDGSGSRVYIAKGDNNPSRDEPIAHDHIRGVVRAQVPYIGYPTVWLRELTVGNKSDQVNK